MSTGMPHDVACASPPEQERAQTHDVSCVHLLRSMTSNDKVEFTYTGVPFGELPRIGTDGFAIALLRLF